MNGQSTVDCKLPAEADKRPRDKSTSLGRRRRQRSRVPISHVDREAVRAVVSENGFKELERLKGECLPGEECEEFYWRIAREQMVRCAQHRPDFAVKIMQAKVGAVGAMLGLPPANITKLVEQVDLPRFSAAAAANRSVQEFQTEPQFRELWREYLLCTNPPLRVVFEHAIVFGSINEAGDIAKNKDWGLVIGIEPLRVDDRLAPRNITYILKPTSKLRMRWEFRDTFKNILGNRRALVNDALRSTKKSFLEYLNDSDTKVIKDRLDLTPGQFWQMARHGEQFGPDGIFSFVKALEEKTKGYVLPFPQPQDNLVQIQPLTSVSSSAPGRDDSDSDSF